jgi:hypothetical protein
MLLRQDLCCAGGERRNDSVDPPVSAARFTVPGMADDAPPDDLIQARRGASWPQKPS